MSRFCTLLVVVLLIGLGLPRGVTAQERPHDHQHPHDETADDHSHPHDEKAGDEEADDEDNAVSLEVGYLADGFANVRGGIDRGTALLDNVDVTASVDLGVVGLDRTTLFVYGLGNHGRSVSALAGDLQAADNIEAPRAWRLYEVHLTHRFLADRLSVRAGLYDLNSEFDVIPAAGLFVNSSFGIGAEYALSRPQGPSIFPVTSLGLRVRATPAPGWYVQSVALDGVPGDPDGVGNAPFRFDENDGLLLAGEAGRVVGSAETPRAKVGLGGWYYTASFDRLRSGRRQTGNGGAYVLGQLALTREAANRDGHDHHHRGHHDTATDAPADESPQGLTAFARVGLADAAVNRISAYTGGGLVYTGALPSRDADQVGLGVAVAHVSDAARTQARQDGIATAAAEWAGEATYAAVLTDAVTLQADAQYIVHPGARAARPNALLLGLRLHLTLP